MRLIYWTMQYWYMYRANAINEESMFVSGAS